MRHLLQAFGSTLPMPEGLDVDAQDILDQVLDRVDDISARTSDRVHLPTVPVSVQSGEISKPWLVGGAVALGLVGFVVYRGLRSNRA